MEIRLYNIGTQKVEYITHDNFNEVIRIASQMKEEDVEVQLVYTTSLIRRVDLSTFINSTKFIVAFIKTEYYSGQPDGSFTIADVNKRLSGIETVILFTEPDLACVAQPSYAN